MVTENSMNAALNHLHHFHNLNYMTVSSEHGAARAGDGYC